MNSTNIKQKNNIHPKIQNFFEQELMLLATELKQQRAIIPWASLDADASTYYKTRQKTRMSKQDFEIGGHSTLETFAADLTTFWENNDDSKLCKMIPSLTELANELYFVEDESEKISPYIYVMF
tara:strand:+ start:1480 stop:1851 length:372 start_codon:yes stop_codon:yes gene_type:complete